jgi:hypothetical protein
MKSSNSSKKQRTLERVRREYDRRLAKLNAPETARRIEAVFATDGVHFKKPPKVDV